MDKLISIIIPSRNRSEYLKYCVKTCLACDDKNIEIIVSDNNSIDDTKDMINEFNDNRLRYFNTNEDISMRANFEFALSKSMGDYVIFIGDDDGVLSNGIKTLRNLIKKYNNPEIINWRHISYSWPETVLGGKDGLLKFNSNNFFGEVKSFSCKEKVMNLCDGIITDYKLGGNIYHGCVSREIIDKVKLNSDIYFYEHAPDVYASFANLLYSENIIWVRNPITIAGESKKSNGAATLSKLSHSNEQKEISNNFEKLGKEDEVKSIMDFKMRVVTAISYACLNRVNKELSNNSLNINHDNWRQAIYNEINNLKPEFIRDNLILAEKLFEELDTSYTAKDYSDLNGSNVDEIFINSPKTKKKSSVKPKFTQDIFNASLWIDKVTGSPHNCFSKNFLIMKLYWVYKMVTTNLRKKTIS